MIEMIYPIKSKKTIRIINISLKNCAKRTVNLHISPSLASLINILIATMQAGQTFTRDDTPSHHK